MHMNGTGGGEPTKKILTDLEERLLNLISKIHLGEQSLPDSFDVSNSDMTIGIVFNQ